MGVCVAFCDTWAPLAVSGVESSPAAEDAAMAPEVDAVGLSSATAADEDEATESDPVDDDDAVGSATAELPVDGLPDGPASSLVACSCAC